MAREESQENPKRHLEDTLHGVTTPINVNENKDPIATGFFYYTPPKIKSNKIYEEVWLVTNRHVVVDEQDSSIPTSLKFRTRRIERPNSIHWYDYKIEGLHKKTDSP
jgi:hypothetical protein